MLKVGKVCDFCSHNDFLPFVCPKCNKTCCTEHREAHPCTAKALKLEATGRERSNLQPRKIEREVVHTSAAAPRSSMTPQKLGMLEKLKAHMAQSPRYQQIRDKPTRPRDKPNTTSKSPATPAAQGDVSVPPAKRHYMHIRRAPISTQDPITGSAITRPELVLYVFYDKTKPIGSALDKAKRSLQMSVATGLELQGTKLPLGSPIGAIPPNSTLTVC